MLAEARVRYYTRCAMSANQSILFFDVETTGLLKKTDRDVTKSASWPRVVSLAWVLADDTGILYHAHHIIRPEGWTIPLSATSCHGITTKQAKEEGVPHEQVMREFAASVQKYQPVAIVAHNLDFDYRMMGSELHKGNLPQVLAGRQACCTMKNSIQFCQLPGKYGDFKWPQLTELHTKLFGTGFPDAHDAMVDVAALIRCYCALCQLGRLQGYPPLKFPHNLQVLNE